MKNTVYLAYQTDCWHSDASKELIGIGSTKNKAIRLIEQFVWNEYKVEMTDECEDQLKSMNQTSASEESEKVGDSEFLIEEVELNTLQ